MPALRKAMAVNITSSGLSSTCRILLSISGALPRWKLDPKAAALARLRFQASASTHSFGAFADQRQPNPSARIDLLAVQSLEQAENLFMVLPGNADAIVLDPQADKARLRGAKNAQAQWPLRRHEFDGIANQITQDLFQSRQMGQDCA